MVIAEGGVAARSDMVQHEIAPTPPRTHQVMRPVK
jgi:hypothetical protein